MDVSEATLEKVASMTISGSWGLLILQGPAYAEVTLG